MPSTDDLVTRLLCGDQRALSRLMTVVERSDPDTAQVMQALHSHAGHAYCIGVTGPPGSGKSTLVDGLARLLRELGKTVGILAIDPTSPFSGGAVLGDRVRMQRHFLDSGVFIRSVATRGGRGGLPPTTQRMVRLLDAAGKDVVLVETVGVGQTELEVMGVADTVAVVLVPESGDAIQTLKAGLLEIGDVFVVNKADREGAQRLVTTLEAMLNMTPRADDWRPPVVSTQAHRGQGIERLWEGIQQHWATAEASSHLQTKRRERRRREFFATVQGWLEERLLHMAKQEAALAEVVRQVERGEVDPYAAGAWLLRDAALLKSWLAMLRPNDEAQ